MLKIENTSDSGVCATHGPAHCADCVYTDCHADDVEIGTKYILVLTTSTS